MFVSQNYMFGPDSPGGVPLIYWTKGTDHPIAEWWSRMTGVLFLSFLSGPFLFGAPMESHLKQTMIMNVGILIMFISIVFGSPDECVKLTWWPQVALQVVSGDASLSLSLSLTLSLSLSDLLSGANSLSSGGQSVGQSYEKCRYDEALTHTHTL